jgi:diaminohydroxyphosphoribosylaminopyrimidine deaminase/5-amino-6-(5-phosphoribosylamino)uracil reductase
LKSLDEKMMALAIAEARKGWGRTSPNPMVGAVLARGDRIISKGYHARLGGDHAERAALNKAGKNAKNATLYVTLEPCNHQGRTPPCTQAVLAAGIKRVVIGQMDPNPHVKGGGAAYLSRKGVDVVSGVLEEQARNLNRFFNKFITTGLPFVLLKSAVTLDGKLATGTGHSRWVSGEKARQFVHRLRNGVDAILVGKGTVLADNPTLNTRLNNRKSTHDPVRVVLDSRLEIPLDSRVINPSLGGPAIVACAPKPDSRRVTEIRKIGADVWPLPMKNGRICLISLLERLGKKNITSLLVEGGAEVNASFLVSENLVDRLMIIYAPKIVGGAKSPTLVGGPGVPVMDQAIQMDVETIRRLGDDILVEAVPKY